MPVYRGAHASCIIWWGIGVLRAVLKPSVAFGIVSLVVVLQSWNWLVRKIIPVSVFIDTIWNTIFKSSQT